jgi:hypothetical protein
MKMTLNCGGQLSIRNVARALFYQCCSRTRTSNVFNSNIYMHFYLPFVQSHRYNSLVLFQYRNNRLSSSRLDNVDTIGGNASTKVDVYFTGVLVSP